MRLRRTHRLMACSLLSVYLLGGKVAAQQAGAGADLTKRIAAPMIAGMFFSFALELFVYPAIYAIWKWHTDVKCQPALLPEAV